MCYISLMMHVVQDEWKPLTWVDWPPVCSRLFVLQSIMIMGGSFANRKITVVECPLKKELASMGAG